MEASYAIVAVIVVTTSLMVFTYAELGRPYTYPSEVSRLTADICAVKQQPGLVTEKTYVFTRPLYIDNGTITLSDAVWVFSTCFNQTGRRLNGPVLVRSPLSLSGITTLRLYSRGGYVWVSKP